MPVNNPLLDALTAIRTAIEFPDVETLAKAEGRVKALPESDDRASALFALDRAIVNADNREWETAKNYAISALLCILRSDRAVIPA